MLSCCLSAAPLDLHSFPTRRSSDLWLAELSVDASPASAWLLAEAKVVASPASAWLLVEARVVASSAIGAAASSATLAVSVLSSLTCTQALLLLLLSSRQM